MGSRQLEIMKFGKVKVQKIKPTLDDIPEDCGYEKKFKYDIDMQSDGIGGDCIAWCQTNCKSRWGWWFKQSDLYDPYKHNWEEQNSYMSFEDKREAMAFFLAIGMDNIGNTTR